MNKWAAFAILLFGLVCFGCGVTWGRSAPQEAVNNPSNVVLAAAPTSSPAPTVTVIQAVPTYPASCMLALETISKMSPDLEVVVNASQKQIVIGNKAYVAVTSKDTEEISRVLSQQYDLNRDTSHSSRQLQEQLVQFKVQMNQCKADLDR